MGYAVGRTGVAEAVRLVFVEASILDRPLDGVHLHQRQPPPTQTQDDREEAFPPNWRLARAQLSTNLGTKSP